MPFTFNLRTMIADDHEIFDATETVTVTQPGSTTGFSVIEARRTNRIVEFTDAAGAAILGEGVVFYLWADVCASRPKLSARITDSDGVNYRVTASSVYSTIRTRYDVTCVKEP